MDRSNSISPNATSSSESPTIGRQGSSANPFAYQTRLLERTASLSRSGSISSRFPQPASPSTPQATRRWTPTHRVASSVDSMRGKWEERAKAELAAVGISSSPTKEEALDSRIGDGPGPYHGAGLRDPGPAPAPAPAPAPVPRDGPAPSPSPGPGPGTLSKRSSWTQEYGGSRRYRSIERSLERPLPSLPSKDVPTNQDPPTPTYRTPPHLKRRTLPTPVTLPLSPDSTGSTHSNTAAMSPSFATPTPKPLHIPASTNLESSSISSVKRLSDYAIPSPSPSPALSPALKRSNSFLSTASGRADILNTSPFPVATSHTDNEPSIYRAKESLSDVSSNTPRRSSSLTRSFPRPSSGLASNSPIPPISPSKSSVMTPTPYRSSYLTSKKAGTYGSVVGRKLGRHLPRIASGDGNDHQDLNDKEDLGKKEDEDERLQREEEERQKERRERRRRWNLEHGREIQQDDIYDLSVKKEVNESQGEQEMIIPGITGADDVQGLRGRLRLSKTSAPSSPGLATPLPSARLGNGLWADTQRHLLQAYEYLCHVGEAQQWMEGCIGDELGFGVVEMEEGLRNGVVLAKLVRVYEGEAIVKRIYDAPKLDFRHSDNINYFFSFVRKVGLPECFIFELTDLYNKKNLPKVIYCIHALSHLLARRGMAQRIGNLVGRLKFSDDQLQQTQKGLKDAGVSMPNFGNVGRELAKEINEEPEQEVVEEESEEERRDRMLLECEDSILQLQSLARGFLERKSRMHARERLRLGQRHIVKLQAQCKAVISRRVIDQRRKQQTRLLPWVIALQAAARGTVERRKWQQRLRRIHAASQIATKIQAQGRGVLVRRRFAKLKAALRGSKVSFVKLQSIARARIVRKTHQEVEKKLHAPVIMEGVVSLQAAARGLLTRRALRRQDAEFQRVTPHIIRLQTQVRGALLRRRVRNQLAKLDDVTDTVVRIQAVSRAYLARKRLLNLIRGLRKATPTIVSVQTLARASLARNKRAELHKALYKVQVVSSVGRFQALARAAITRNRHREQQKELDFVEPDVLGFQAAARGALLRNDYLAWRDHLHQSHPAAIHLQSLFRGLLQQKKFREKMDFYRANLNKVVKIQSLFRAKETREQYRQLTMGTNVSVGTIKNFVHLLDDSEADFEDEIELEQLRKKVVEGIRENQRLETELSDLDVKIALVVQNVKSFEELIKARKRHSGDSAAAHAARASILAAHGDPFASSTTLDRTARQKLELYQQLLYMLQTKGEYLARLFFTLSRSNVPEKNKRSAERIVLTLFGYGQDRREEYLLLKLLQICIREEIRAARTIEEVTESHPMYMAIAVHYVRPKQVNYVKETLHAVIHEVIDQEDLDLETDPTVIYRTRINVEEMRSGRVSDKPKELSYHQAVNDPDTRAEFIRHLQLLVALSRGFVTAIVNSTKKMPYGMQCIAKEILGELKAKYPSATEEQYAACLGRVIFYRFINPAIVTPETFDIVPSTLSAAARKNLAEISKILTQISSGHLFGDNDPCLIPINSFVDTAIKDFSRWFLEVANVADAEAQLHAHEFLDVTVQPKPVYISPNEVYTLHSLLAQNMEKLILGRDDDLRILLTELNGVPNLGDEELNDARDHPITLELTNRFAHVQDPHAEEKALWVQCKRGVLAILRVQPAKDLLESLFQPVEEEHEFIWEDIVEHELILHHKRNRRMPSTTGADTAYRLDDIRSLSFRDVKANAITYLLQLEKMGKITRVDGYQGILDAIASDVRSKHRKRLERQTELRSMQEARKHLAERKKYFEEQINSYNSYIETAMNTMQRGKGKKRFVIPFTKQYFHLRELQKSGKNPRFGSYKYSAQKLYEKGVLLSIDQYSPRQFDRIDIVISSDEVGIFTMELYNTATGNSHPVASTETRMEDLLQAQFENRVSLALFNGTAKFSLNLLLYQINKEFYV
ncbi:hypothetical protein M422DRAFT_72916 [Sphaerobolus stellatus SS14]|nr:hypothetical protein M422DRAFT_72916 [Sphaerobolus stellatus SS14]